MINGFKISIPKLIKSYFSKYIFLLIFPFSEISKVRANLFQINGYVKEPLILPDGVGPPIIHTEKVYVPVKEHPEVSSSYLFNYIYSFLVSKYFTDLSTKEKRFIFNVQPHIYYLNSVEVISKTTLNEVTSRVIDNFSSKESQSNGLNS